MNFYQGVTLKECFLGFYLIFPEVSGTERIGIPIVRAEPETARPSCSCQWNGRSACLSAEVDKRWVIEHFVKLHSWMNTGRIVKMRLKPKFFGLGISLQFIDCFADMRNTCLFSSLEVALGKAESLQTLPLWEEHKFSLNSWKSSVRISSRLGCIPVFDCV